MKAAILFLVILCSCSPQKRLSRLLNKHPELITYKVDTVTVTKEVEKEIPLHVVSDTIRFDSLLIEFYRIREDYHHLNSRALGVEKSQIELNELKYRMDLLRNEIRKGAYVETTGHWVSRDSLVSFDWFFDPQLKNPFGLSNLKVQEKTIKEREFIKIEPTTKDAFAKLWWLWVGIAVLIIGIIVKTLIK